MKKVICSLVLLLPLLGKAEVQKILDITSESNPDLVSIMSIDVGSTHAPNNLVYTPDENKNEVKTFPTQDLLEDSVTIVEEKGVEIVGLKLKQINPTNYIVNLHYLYQYKLFKKTYKDKQLNVSFSSPDNRYLVQDDETKKSVTRLHFVSHYNDKGKEVGIEKIETL